VIWRLNIDSNVQNPEMVVNLMLAWIDSNTHIEVDVFANAGILIPTQLVLKVTH